MDTKVIALLADLNAVYEQLKSDVYLPRLQIERKRQERKRRVLLRLMGAINRSLARQLADDASFSFEDVFRPIDAVVISSLHLTEKDSPEEETVLHFLEYVTRRVESLMYRTASVSLDVQATQSASLIDYRKQWTQFSPPLMQSH